MERPTSYNACAQTEMNDFENLAGSLAYGAVQHCVPLEGRPYKWYAIVEV